MQITQNTLINGMPEDVYHSDPTPILDGFTQSASLSSSMASCLLSDSEEEAMMTSKRLNPKYVEKTSDAMDLGTMAHELVLLGSLKNIVVCSEFDSWRTSAAKDRKAEIEAQGKIALNSNTRSILDDVQEMKVQLHNRLNGHRDYPSLMMKGRGEVSAFAYDGEIWNRARFDWLDDNYPDIIVDYKTTALTFKRWIADFWREGKYIQSPHYRKVFDIITGRKSKFIFVVQRTVAPFDVMVFCPDDSYGDEYHGRYELARKKFVNGLKTGLWRGHPPYTVHGCPPPYILTDWEIQSLEYKDLEKKEAERSASKQEPQILTMAG